MSSLFCLTFGGKTYSSFLPTALGIQPSSRLLPFSHFENEGRGRAVKSSPDQMQFACLPCTVIDV